MTRRHYLDYNATAPLRPEVREAMTAAFGIFGNPSSVHREGREAKAAVERARAQVAALAGCETSEVVFTSGATESNQTVIGAGWGLIAASAMEHESVLAAGRHAVAGSFREIPALRNGEVDVERFAAMRREFEQDGERPGSALVSVQLANGETGAVQPLGRMVEIAREQDYLTHCDAVQAAGRIRLDFAALGVDFLSLSAHKLGGPKGAGALIVRRGVKLAPLVRGGGQETGHRAGTENVAGIVGFGVAADCARRELARMAGLAAMRDRLEREALALAPNASVLSQAPVRLANTTALALPDVKAETLVIAFDLAGIAVSAGSACSSGKVSRSHVLRAMGVPAATAEGTIRVSFGWDTREADIDAFLNAWAGLVKQHERCAVA